MTPTASGPHDGRDLRLDVLRGLSLVMIYFGHIPESPLGIIGTRNLGPSDAAEGFILIAGCAAALAYGHWFRPGLPWPSRWIGAGHVWGRVWRLYLVHLLITVLAVGVITGLARWLGIPALLEQGPIRAFLDDPGGAMLRMALLIQHQKYVNILPMYVVLLATAPAVLVLAWRFPRLVLLASIALWVASNARSWTLPDYPPPYTWTFNPLVWQLLFVIGLLGGLAMRQGRPLVPRHAGLMALAAGVLVLGLLLKIPPVGRGVEGLLDQAQQAGWPRALVGHDKKWLPLLRVVHVLALAYVLMSSDRVRRACASALMAPLAMLGRQALAVFALGTVIAVALQPLPVEGGDPVAAHPALILAGLAAQFALAAVREAWPSGGRGPA